MTTADTFLSIGECMIEFHQSEDGSWKQGFAGDTFNTAWHFQNGGFCGRWRASYLTRVGTDPFSRQMTEFFADQQIGIQWISRDPERKPGLYLISTQDGERSFTYWREASAARGLADDFDGFRDALEAASCIYFSGITLAILAPKVREAVIAEFAAARARGTIVSFDPNMRPALWKNTGEMCDTIMAAAASANVVLPGLDEQKEHFGDATSEVVAQRYLDVSAEEVVVKNGGGPVLIANRDAMHWVRDLKAVKPIDTTGAGDSFNGVYLALRLNGRDPQEAVRHAHEAASQVVQHRGAIPGTR